MRKSLEPKLINNIADFLTYVSVRGNEYNKVIKALTTSGADVIFKEAEILKSFNVRYFSDLINEEEVWNRIDSYVKFNVPEFAESQVKDAPQEVQLETDTTGAKPLQQRHGWNGHKRSMRRLSQSLLAKKDQCFSMSRKERRT